VKVSKCETAHDFTTPLGIIAIIASTFNDVIVDKLVEGAKETLSQYGVTGDNLDIFTVPGAFELPLVCQVKAQSGHYVGIIALGAVIQGETPHFDYVCSACAHGIIQAQLSTNIPITFGVLTTDTVEQAQARAGGAAGNKGKEAAIALLDVLMVLQETRAAINE
jgi:6,7-dimethyl-8-ribityllumazine synthase